MHLLIIRIYKNLELARLDDLLCHKLTAFMLPVYPANTICGDTINALCVIDVTPLP